MEKLRIATRKSPLAMWQAEHVSARLAELGVMTELIPLASSGDTDMRPIDGTRQTGVFTKRIQQALLDDEADIAVHSLKDLPTEGDPKLLLVAVPERESVADALISSHGGAVDRLPEAARVGTGSRRRMAQLLHHRPDLQVSPIRGNVQTRLSKLASGEFDAIILAEAGILRLKMHDLTRHTLSMDEMLPAPGQGALGIEVRADDPRAIEAVSGLDHLPARSAVTAERVLLAALHGGCLAPIAALGQQTDQTLSLRAMVLSQDGKHKLEEVEQIDLSSDNSLETASELGRRVSSRLIEQGAAELLRR